MSESLAVAEDAGVASIMGFATSAIREAPNGEQVIDQVHDATGVRLELLSGEDEGRLTFLAVRRWFGWSSGRLIVFDIGGGSLEIAVGSDEEPDDAISLELGAGRLTRAHISGAPADPEEVRALRRLIRTEMADVVSSIDRLGPPDLAVATSKTFRQLARITGAARRPRVLTCAGSSPVRASASGCRRSRRCRSPSARRCRGCPPDAPGSWWPGRWWPRRPWTCSATTSSCCALGAARGRHPAPHGRT